MQHQLLINYFLKKIWVGIEDDYFYDRPSENVSLLDKIALGIANSVNFIHQMRALGLVNDEEAFKKEVLQVVTKEIGPIAKPDRIQLVSGLPKTRSGKIMRRILRKIASGDTSNLGDTSTLLNPDVVEAIKKAANAELVS